MLGGHPAAVKPTHVQAGPDCCGFPYHAFVLTTAPRSETEDAKYTNKGQEKQATIPVKDIKGATEAMLAKLKEMAIGDNETLLTAAASPAQRKELAAACGCAPADILGVANRADLARVSGVAGVYSDLLEQAGVDTVKELATRRPDNLFAKLIATNDAAKLTQRPPTEAMVKDWIAQAKGLAAILTY